MSCDIPPKGGHYVVKPHTTLSATPGQWHRRRTLVSDGAP